MLHLAGVGDSSEPFRGDEVSLEVGLETGTMARRSTRGNGNGGMGRMIRDIVWNREN